ncbi:transposase [Candidatus Vondammii sp. HM_W22]|uniref:transposase n=1 Tax=Candidatus Vondammii sp. HM_W22 TaxID=2687299 RepID=UPI00403DDE3A
MFKVLVLQHLFNLSGDQTKFHIRYPYSFCRFLGLSQEVRYPIPKQFGYIVSA